MSNENERMVADALRVETDPRGSRLDPMWSTAALTDLVDVYVVVRRPTNRLMNRQRIAEALGWSEDSVEHVLAQLLRLGWVAMEGGDARDPRYVPRRDAKVKIR